MQISNFKYRYGLTANDKPMTIWFTSRDEARAMKRQLSTSSTKTYTVVRQAALWGDSTPVR